MKQGETSLATPRADGHGGGVEEGRERGGKNFAISLEQHWTQPPSHKTNSKPEEVQILTRKLGNH